MQHRLSNTLIPSLLGLMTLFLMGLALFMPAQPVSAACTGGNYATDVQADSPIVYLRLGEAAGGTADNIGSLGAAADGTYSNVTLAQTSLVANDADTSVLFNGTNSSINIVNNNSINTATFQNKTIELMFVAADLTGRQVIYEQGGGTRGLNIYLDGSTLYAGAWNLANDDGGTSSPWGGFWLNTTVQADTAYHVVLVMEGDATGLTGTVTAYLNGTSFGSQAGVGRIFSHSGGIEIGDNDNTLFHDSGGVQDSGAYPFAGLIDELALYNTALSSPEVSQHIVDCFPPLSVTLSGTSTSTAATELPIAALSMTVLTIITAVVWRRKTSKQI